MGKTEKGYKMRLRWKLAYWIMRRRKRTAKNVEEIRARLLEGWVEINLEPGVYYLDEPLIITKPCILNGHGAELVAKETAIIFRKKKKGPTMIRDFCFRGGA